MEVSERSLPPETTEKALGQRHKRELQELECRAQAHIEEATLGAKGKRMSKAVASAQQEVDKRYQDLQERQAKELGALRKHLGLDVAEAKAQEARTKRKQDRAQKKREEQYCLDAELARAIDLENFVAPTTDRDIEIVKLAEKLAKRKPAMQVFEVAADGNCLYRSLAHQLHQLRPELHAWKSEPKDMYREVRSICAASLRDRCDDYSPFAELADGEDYDGYCSRVENSADWGGQLELRAIADGLSVCILVHCADEDEPLALGEGDGAPLQVSYHRHYYALGEHYNSVMPKADV